MNEWNPLQAAIALFEESERQHKRNSELLNRLNNAAARYEAAAALMPAQIAKQLNEVLADAASNAAKQIASKWTAANEHADRASVAYAKAAHMAPWHVFLLAALGMVVASGAMIFIAFRIVPNPDTVIAWRMEEANLRARVDLLEKRGGNTRLAYCNDSRGRQHLCIAVDETMKTNLNGYRIIRGR